MQYRIKYYSYGGSVLSGNTLGYPVASHQSTTLLAVMKSLRDVLNTDTRIGVKLGVSIQYRVIHSGQWFNIDYKTTNSHALELRLENWILLHP